MQLSPDQSHSNASVIRAREVSGFRLAETLYSPQTKVPHHSHEQALFCIALRGVCSEVYAGTVRKYETQTVEFLPANEAHSLDFPLAEVRAFSVGIDPQWLERARDYSLFLDNSIHLHGGLLSGLLMKLYQEFRLMDDASSLAIEGLALEMLAEVSRRQIKPSDYRPPRWLAQALEILHERFSEHLTILQIATCVGIHPVHLAREFRRFHRCTIGEYIRRLRIEHACHELWATDAPLAEIASAAGFSDQSHLSRSFKRIMGTTPGEYRAVLRRR
jgi:AraC family transcriptional regulator